MLERVLVALLAGGHLLLEGVPGLAKTLTIQTLAEALDASFRRIQFTPDLVPADLVGHPDLPPLDRQLRHRARPGVLQLPARRRDQPRTGQGPERAARGDAGAPGHDRPREPPRPDPVPRDGDPEPDRVRGHLPAARGPDRPVHDEGRRRLPDRRRGGHGRRALPPARGRGARDPRRGRARPAPGRDPEHLRRPGDHRLRGRRSSPPPATPSSSGRAPSRATSPTAPARAARSTSSTPPGRSRCCAAAGTSSRPTSPTSPPTSSATASSRASRPSPRRSPRT